MPLPKVAPEWVPLLDADEDPNRYNLEGNHAHSTPLHQAVLGGHEAVVRLLVERGVRLDIRDTIWQSTPLGWALHGDPDTYRYIPASIRTYPGAHGVARLLETRGFVRVEHRAVLGGLLTIHVAHKPGEQ